mmetsp:Transcript_24328/g.58993  ORF Transcript_24328/g.58993 Transcript_24328/m.58993 type:complete len:235 (-) Transcript_24328:296-1000(-)
MVTLHDVGDHWLPGGEDASDVGHGEVVAGVHPVGVAPGHTGGVELRDRSLIQVVPTGVALVSAEPRIQGPGVARLPVDGHVVRVQRHAGGGHQAPHFRNGLLLHDIRPPLVVKLLEQRIATGNHRNLGEDAIHQNIRDLVPGIRGHVVERIIDQKRLCLGIPSGQQHKMSRVMHMRDEDHVLRSAQHVLDLFLGGPRGVPATARSTPLSDQPRPAARQPIHCIKYQIVAVSCST